MFGAKYRTTAHRDTSYFRDWCVPKMLDEAFNDFKAFFRSKAGYEWDFRLKNIKINNKFVYIPPAEGRPVGFVPLGCEREERKKECDEDTSTDDVADDTDSEVDDDEGASSSERMTDLVTRGATVTAYESDSELEDDQNKYSRSDKNNSTIRDFSTSRSSIGDSDVEVRILGQPHPESSPDAGETDRFSKAFINRMLSFLFN
jgi:hypothetical protein